MVSHPFFGHYYFQKYTMWYHVVDDQGIGCVYFTLPVPALTDIYQDKTGEQATSFFDCGCGTGVLLHQAEEMGLRVKGIDVTAYPIRTLEHQHQVKNIEIVSILDYTQPIDYDIAFCNGSLTYLTEKTIPVALQKLKASRLVIAIHNTTEDEKAAGYPLSNEPEPQLIRSQKWWLKTFRQAGFNAEYDPKSQCFLASARHRERS